MPKRTPREVEVKLRVADIARTRRLLARLGRVVTPRVHEQNTLFDSPRRTLRKRGSLLRLRVTHPDPGSGPAKGLLTYKGASLRPAKKGASNQGGPRYKVREEIETAVADPAEFHEILAAVGLKPAFRYEKYRTAYRLRGAPGAHVELDETPVGVFLEIEGAPRAIDRAAKLLGYGPKDYLTSSYLALHAEACRRRGAPVRNMLFPRKVRAKR